MGTFGRPCFAKSKHRLSEKRSFSTVSDRPQKRSVFLFRFASSAAQTQRREQHINACQQDERNCDDRHAVLPRGHVDHLEVGQHIRLSARLELGAEHHQQDVDDERANFEVQEVEREQVHHQTVAYDMYNDGQLGREARHARTEDAHDHDRQNRHAVITPHLVEKGADAGRQVEQERRDDDGREAEHDAELLCDLDQLCVGALLLRDDRQDVEREQRHRAVQDRVKRRKNSAEHDCGEKAEDGGRQDVLDEGRVRHVEVGQHAAVTDELDDAGRNEEHRTEYERQTGQQRALLRFLEVFRAEHALHDRLVGAVIRNVIDAAAEQDHRPRDVRRLRVRRLNGVQMLGRGGRENADALRDAAVAQRDEREHGNEHDRADDEDQTVERVRDRDRLEAAEDRIDAADNAERDAHDGRRHKAVAAHECGDAENTLHGDRAGVEHERKHGNDIRDKEDERYDDARCAVKAALQKFRDGGDAELEVLRDEEQRHQRQRDRTHGLPAHRRHAGGVALSVSSDELLCRQIGHHQRAEDDDSGQTASAEEVAVLVRLVRILGFDPAYKCHQRGDKYK